MRMKRFLLALGLVAAALAVEEAQVARAEPRWVEVCPTAPAGYARCFAEVLADTGHTSEFHPEPDGYGPAQIKTAYGFPTGSKAGLGKTVAVVSAFEAPTVEADLATFSSEFGLRPCTTGNGCFTKVYARGSAPAADELWALESNLDTQWIHGIAPGAKIILVLASSNNFVDLLQAFQVATGLSSYVTSSWGGPEFELETIFDPLFDVTGLSAFFASGDNGAPGAWPAAHPQAIGVGGTRLLLNANDYKQYETGWSGSGGGCSVYYDAGAVQAAFAQYPAVCAGKRAYPDIAAIADPQSGTTMFTSYGFLGHTGWLRIAGTSVAAPIMAARAAITGAQWTPEYLYSSARKLFDPVYGNNGFKAKPGYDLVTGRGRFRA